MSIETFTPAEMKAFERVMRNAVRNDFYAFVEKAFQTVCPCLLYTSPSPRDRS